MGFRQLALAVGFTAALLGAPGMAHAAGFGHWRVTATGSVTHKWTLTNKEPCAAVGSGRVTAAAHGRSKRFTLRYYERDSFRQWEIPPPQFRVRGKVRRTDGTKQNPPKRDAGPCTPTRKNGCGVSRPLHRAIGSVEGMIPRRRARLTFSFYYLMDAFPERSHCYSGRFGDFNNFPGAPFANYGRMVGKMPRPAQIGRRAFTVRLFQRRRTHKGHRRTTTVRRVKLRFTPV